MNIRNSFKVFASLFLFSTFLHAVDFTQDQYLRDFDYTVELFEVYHDNLNVYRTEAEYDEFVNTQRLRITEDLTLQEFYIIIAETVVYPRCTHTHSSPPLGMQKDLFIPFVIHFDGEKVKVIEDLSLPLPVETSDAETDETSDPLPTETPDLDTEVDPDPTEDILESRIPLLSNIVSINGEMIETITADLRKLVSRDGFIESKVRRVISRNFWELYAVSRAYPAEYEITYEVPVYEEDGTLLNHESITEIFDAIPGDRHRVAWIPPETSSGDPSLDLEIFPEEGFARMRVGHFAFYSNPDFFNNFVDSSFETLQTNEIDNLILDVRWNGGGDPFAANYLLSYLSEDPFQYFNSTVTSYSTLQRPTQPALNVFKGNVYVLIDGFVGSTNGHFVSLLEYLDLAEFVGEESGATYFCSGNGQSFQTPNTRIEFTIGRSQFYTAVEGLELGQGIEPDHSVIPSAKEWRSGVDVVYDYAVHLIENRVTTFSAEPEVGGVVVREGGLEARLRAVPNEGYQFVEWKELEDTSINPLPFQDPVEIATHYTAVFEVIPVEL